jgi:nuclear transport factor 2 (NTF2) superfamily protein
MSSISQPAQKHIRDAENAWNLGDLEAIVMSNSIDCFWRARVNFLWGREHIRAYVERQPRREIDFHTIFEGWAESEGRLSMRFASEFRNDSGTWFRAYGSEEMEFDRAGLVIRRLTAANEHPIQEHERRLVWPRGRRPSAFPTLSELGF